MSTKTTIKRIALVAVAALGFGVVSVAPSSATVTGDTYTLSESTTTVALGTAASVTLTTAGYFGSAGDSVTVTAALKTYPSAATAPQIASAISTIVFSDIDTATAYTGGSAGGSSVTNSTTTSITGVAGAAPKLVSTRSKLTVTPTVVGTYTYTLTPSVAAVNVTAVTWTVVVTAVGLAATATSFLNAGETTAATADAVVSAPLAASATVQSASIVVTSKNAAAVDVTSATALTVTITGPGSLGIDTAANVAAIVATGRALTGTAGQNTIGVFSDGTSGTAVVTISAGTTVLATETVTFYGAAAKITPTVVNSVLAIGANTGVITAVVTDANGTLVPGVTVYASSNTDATIDDAYVASTAVSSATGAVSFNLTGVAAGTAAITLTLNSTSAGTSTVSALAGTMRVSDGVVTKVDYKFALDSYAPGAPAVITATVSNAAGVMPAGTYTVLSSAGVTANYTVAGLPAATVLAVGSTGVATYTVTIPTGVSGDLQLAGTASATTITATFGKTTVVNTAQDTAQAAVDAAAEAIDAANAATDAANAAAEAADAATAAAQDAADAVAALSVAVTAQIDALKAQNDALRKQLIALTNLIIKIQKKVKA
jgi:hypothetical protein